MPDKFETVDQYVAAQPEEVQEILETVRSRVRELVPGGEEVISYQIPTIKLDGKYLVYFAAWKTHISLHPVPPLEGALESKVTQYRSGKDTLRFPLDEPIPYQVIDEVVTAMLGMRRRGRE